MKVLYDTVSLQCSKLVTIRYSTSFSLGIKLLSRPLHSHIYAIYGFVRLADEIVDSFHDYPAKRLLQQFREQTYDAIDIGISLNPILNSFQHTVRQYGVERELIDTFLESMEMDLTRQTYSQHSYERYILGSAEVVGLMCLRVFCNGDKALYDHLKPSAMKLGAAFQKINFLRDIKADTEQLGRMYFPDITLNNFTREDKQAIESDIEADLHAGLKGILQLPASSRKGVYLAYAYYKALFNKIKRTEPEKIMTRRIRIPNTHKLGIMVQTLLKRSIGNVSSVLYQ